MSQKVFHSRVYGAMNKRRRRQLGLAGYRREEVWRRMAEQEARLAAVARWRPLAWWKRLLEWISALPGRLRERWSRR